MSQMFTAKKNVGMKRKQIAGKTITYIVLAVLSVIWIIPLVWMVIQSFAAPTVGDDGAMLSSFGSSSLIPTSFDIYWYKQLFTSTQYPYLNWFFNTLIMAVVCLFLSTFFTISMAYVMSRFRFKSRKTLQSVGLILGMFPGFMSMAAIYQIFRSVGMAGEVEIWKKHIALIMVYSGSASLGYYVSKGFFDTISKSLDEAARIDGATNSQVFFKIVLPLAKPIIVYTALMSFLGPWGDFIFASYLLGAQAEGWTVAVGLYNMVTTGDLMKIYNMFLAGAVLVAVPITALFIGLQRYFVEGITGGAVKG